MLVHHSNEDYSVAATRAVEHAKARLDIIVSEGISRTSALIERVSGELPTDNLSYGRHIKVQYNSSTDKFIISGFAIPREGEVILTPYEYELTQHALMTVLSRLKLPSALKGRLTHSLEEKKVLADLLTEVFSLQEQTEVNLLRTLDGRTKAVLSDSYRIMDSRQIVEAFASACQTFGAIPVDGSYMDTRISLRALLPKVFTPAPDEVMAIGLVLGNSDYGDGALTLKLFALRLWCTNYAIMEDVLRRVHLGKKMDPQLLYSGQTLDLYSRAAASEVKDAVKAYLDPEGKGVSEVLARITQASKKEVPEDAAERLLPKGLSMEESRKVVEVFQSPDNLNLPPGRTVYRLSNAVSWVAQTAESLRRKEEMQELAGELLM